MDKTQASSCHVDQQQTASHLDSGCRVEDMRNCKEEKPATHGANVAAIPEEVDASANLGAKHSPANAWVAKEEQAEKDHTGSSVAAHQSSVQASKSDESSPGCYSPMEAREEAEDSPTDGRSERESLKRSRSSSEGESSEEEDLPQPKNLKLPQRKGGMQLWQFLYTLLTDPDEKYSELIQWTDKKREFRLQEPEAIAVWWGEHKNKKNMSYDKLSRSLRYYYDKGIIRKIPGERYVYQFCVDPEMMYEHIGISESRPKLKPMPTSAKLAMSKYQQDLAYNTMLEEPPYQMMPPEVPLFLQDKSFLPCPPILQPSPPPLVPMVPTPPPPPPPLSMLHIYDSSLPPDFNFCSNQISMFDDFKQSFTKKHSLSDCSMGGDKMLWQFQQTTNAYGVTPPTNHSLSPSVHPPEIYHPAVFTSNDHTSPLPTGVYSSDSELDDLVAYTSCACDSYSHSVPVCVGGGFHNHVEISHWSFS